MQTEKPVMVIRTDDLEKTRLFYEALGLSLAEERHEGCPPHYSCDFGGLLLEFYPPRKGGAVKVGNDLTLFFETDRFDVVLDIARKLGLHREPIKVYDVQRGVRIVTIYDPDDRPVRVREIGNRPPH